MGNLPDELFSINCGSVRSGIRMIISGTDKLGTGVTDPGYSDAIFACRLFKLTM